MIGLGTAIREFDEFHRRAVVALRGVQIPASESFLLTMLRRVDIRFTEAERLAFVRAVHRYRRHISDKLVTDYAADHANEAD